MLLPVGRQLHPPRPSRRVVTIGGIIFFVLIVAALVAAPVIFGIGQSDLERWGLLGVFVANFLGNAAIIVPVPALGVVGQALIVTQADTHNFVLVALVGGVAMTLGEITAYSTGTCGRALSSNRLMPLQNRFEKLARRPADVVSKIMLRYGIPTLFVLSVIPNPVFEFAGIAAGATRMNFWHFLAAVGLGKTIRAFILATLGDVFF